MKPSLRGVLAHVKDARQLLPASIEFSSWLRTPIEPGAKSPLEYLLDGRLRLFRGLVLRAISVEMDLAPVVSSIPSCSMTYDERINARERINPSPRVVEDED